MARLLTIVLPIALAFLSGRAYAQEPQQDPRVANAKTACASGDVQQAIRLLAELYTATNDPIWIFNQGRCYHQNNQFPQAVARFKEFLRKNSNGPAEDNREAQSYISEIEAELRKNEPTGPAQVGPSAVQQAGQAGPLLPAGVQAGQVTQTQPAAPPSTAGRRLRYAGIGCFALGGAGLVTGMIFTLLKQHAEGDVENQTQQGLVPYGAVGDKFSDGRTYADLQWVGYGIGAGALITGGVLYYLGLRKANAAASTTVAAPLAVAGGAGVVILHSF